MRIKKIFAGILVATASSLPPGTACHACEGADLEQANRLYEHMEFVNRTCNESGTVQDSLNCLQEEWGYTVQKLDKLPESCRAILSGFESQTE
jgi:hypothetical protein